ncbi:MAG: bifunctional pyr operon transcriptional regulator/uracil phosphoribosyltransferase PyrR [Myxococcota bacterium]
MEEILSYEQASQGLQRLAREIVERTGGASEFALVGIRRGGPPIAQRIAELVQAETGVQVPMGAVDITLYRDDAPAPLPNPRIGRSDVPFDVSTKKIVLVDDVLFTGRTVRAAMHALLDYGRSRAILLAVLVDRGGRELPIQPDFVVATRTVEHPQRVEVFAKEQGFRALIVEPERSVDA